MRFIKMKTTMNNNMEHSLVSCLFSCGPPPPPLDHVMSFFVVRSHWMYHIAAIHTK